MNKFTKNQKKNKYFSKISKILALFLVIMLPFGALAEINVKSESKLIQAIQTNRITLKMQDSSLEEILSSICKQANVQYIVKSGVVLSGNQSIDVKNKTVETTLNQLLANTSYSYTVEDEIILITNKPKPLLLTSLQDDNKTTVTYIGKVVDEKGNPIVGATVIVVDTPIGAITDDKGNFILRTIIGSKVQVSFVGMVQQEFVIDGKSTETQTIKLVADELVAEDVIVTGYGNVDRLSFTGSTTTVTGEELLKVSPTNVLSALQVFDPSYRIMTNNEMGSDPNTMPEFYVRGQSGISGTTELDVLTGSVSEYELVSNPNAPVFILDGAEVDMSVIYDMDPTRIKTMTILKDAASTAIYGSRAANGVIVVETNSPEPGKLRVSYALTATVTAPDLTSYNLMDADQKLETELAAGLLWPESESTTSIYFYTRLSHYRDIINYMNQGVDTYWLSYPIQVGLNQKHSLTLDGGSDDFRFSLGLSYSNENGVMKESLRDNMGVNFSINYKANNKLRITNKITLNSNSASDSPYGSFSDYARMQPYFSPYDLETGDVVKTLPGTTSSYILNPLYSIYLDDYSVSGYLYLANNFSLDYYINKDFRFTTQFSISMTTSDSESFTDPLSTTYSGMDADLKGRLKIGQNTATSWNLNSILQYNKSLGKNNINARLGMNLTESVSESMYSTYAGFSNSTLVSPMFSAGLYGEPTISDSNSRLAGAFLAANYTYNNTYLFDISARMDGSSEFGSNNRYAPFWSLGAGINMHNYEFVKNIDAINILRFTTNFGQTGKVNFSPYMANNTYQIQTDGWYFTGIGATLLARGNSDLTWEKTNTLNVALDATLLDKRLNLGLTYYNKRTIDLVSNTSVPMSTGFTSYKDNIGEVENVGYEFSLSYALIRQKDMGLNLSVNGASNRGTILKISDSQKAYNEAVIEYFESVSTSNNNPILQYVEGGSLTSIFGAKSLGISPSTGEEIFYVSDGTISTEWSADNQYIIGNTEPDLNGSIGINFTYKSFSVYTTFMYSIGGDVYNSTLATAVEGINIFTYNVDERVLTERWQEVGDISQYKAISLTETYVQPTSRFVQQENYLKFNSFSFSWSLKDEWLKPLGISMCRLTASTNDVFTLSTVKQERGTSYPFSRSFNLSLNLSF